MVIVTDCYNVKFKCCNVSKYTWQVKEKKYGA